MTTLHTPLTQLKFDVLEHGWNILEIGSGNDTIAISASGIFTNPCEDLMIYCERVLSRDFGATVRFSEEPNYSILEFSVERAIPVIKLMCQAEWDKRTNKMEEIRTWSVDPGYFAALCIGEFKRLAFLSDQPEFAKNRPQFLWKAYHSLLKRWDDAKQPRDRARKQK